MYKEFSSIVPSAGSDAAVRMWSMASGQLQSVLAPKDLGARPGHPCVPVLGICEDPPSAFGSAVVTGSTMATGPALLVALNSDVSVFQF